MTQRFNPKQYLGKFRIFKKVSGEKDLQRIWCWNDHKKSYQPPPNGHPFVARRYETTPSGGRTRVKKTFASLEEARQWQRKLGPENPVYHPKQGPTFGEIYEAFWKKKISKLTSGTQANHARYIRLHFDKVMPIPIKSITPAFVDALLERWRHSMETHQSQQRLNFNHELSVLRSVLKFYEEYFEDPEFKNPLKQRHNEDAFLKKAPSKHKDLQEGEFHLFVNTLKDTKWGDVLSAMAIVQFYQALRIGEVAALRFEDVCWDFKKPDESTIRVCQHVVYPRTGGVKPQILSGYKNSRNGEIKELPLFRESYEALKSVFVLGGKGLIFGLTSTEPFTYRMIQKAYDTAFAKAGLPYTGTHVLRHGGTRRVFNATNGDLSIAKQLLGNTDLKSTLVYAQRDKTALKGVAQNQWKNGGSG